MEEKILEQLVLTNLKESDIALKIGMMVKENLENAFEKVITTRDR